MDKYLVVRKQTLQTTPYPLRTKLEKDRQRWLNPSTPLSVSGKMPSSSATTKHLLNTLSDGSNPITHSNIYERSDTVVSPTTGHQRGEGRIPRSASASASFEDRSRKLALQRREEPTEGALSNVHIYIDGYLDGTTDIEMKRIISQAGGTTLLIPRGATHIVTSQQLNGLKTHKFLTAKCNLVHVVKPEWVTDSVTTGRRLPEYRYALIGPSSTRNLVDMLKCGRSS